MPQDRRHLLPAGRKIRHKSLVQQPSISPANHTMVRIGWYAKRGNTQNVIVKTHRLLITSY